MEPERWRMLEEIYTAALASKKDERAAVIASACGNDEALRREVESLLSYSERTTQPLEGAAFDLMAQHLAFDLTRGTPAQPDRLIGSRIGPYQVVEKLGAGGMGEVYRANRADDEYEQNVALKLLRDQDSGAFVHQFRVERQVLADLQHPNIARLFDGGTSAQGLPYFAMELVEGQPVDEYCDQKRLTVTERLNLFLQIASAVQYAHQRLIIHRDIKPSNILVKAEGTPVLLDFGIAKILDPSGVPGTSPATTMRMMTPEYACPEQIKGGPITAATDVYSLGVVLYQLVTGRRPYRFDTRRPLEVAHAICDQEAKRPSTVISEIDHLAPGTAETIEEISRTRSTDPRRLTHQLRGDLDAILLKALRKEPEQRYATVREFADDIRRYLEGRPVLAYRGSRWYQIRKFVVRHRGGAAITAVVLLLAMIGVTLIVRAERRARAEEALAEQRFNDLRTLANSLLFEIHDSIRDLPGSTPARKLLVDRALKYLDGLSREASGDIGLQRDLAAAYERVGDVQGSPNFANLGDTAGAIESYRKALRIRQAITGPQADISDQMALAESYLRLGFAVRVTNDFHGAEQAFQRAYEVSEKLESQQPKNPQFQEAVASACFGLGGVYDDLGDLKRSIEYYDKSIAVRESIRGLEPPLDRMVRMRLAGTYGYMSGVVSQQGDLKKALALQTKSRDIMAELAVADPNNATLRGFLLQAEYWVGYYLAKMSQPADALPHYRVALSGYEKLAAADPKESLTQRYLALTYTSLGSALAATGKFSEALKDTQTADRIFSTLVAQDSSDLYFKFTQLAHAHSAIAEIYAMLATQARQSRNERRTNWQLARTWYNKSLDVWTHAKAAAPLGHFDAKEPEKVKQQLVRCDAELAQLR